MILSCLHPFFGKIIPLENGFINHSLFTIFLLPKLGKLLNSRSLANLFTNHYPLTTLSSHCLSHFQHQQFFVNLMTLRPIDFLAL